MSIGNSEELRRAGYHVVELWECDYDKTYKDDPDLRNFGGLRIDKQRPFESQEMLYLVVRLTQPNPIRKSIKHREEIKYIDVCSLYPFICQVRTFSTWTSQHLFSREY